MKNALEGFNIRLQAEERMANSKTGHLKLSSQRNKKKETEKEERKLKECIGHINSRLNMHHRSPMRRRKRIRDRKII